MKNYTIKIEKLIPTVSRTFTFEEVEAVEKKITKKQFEDLMEFGCTNSKLGFLQLVKKAV